MNLRAIILITLLTVPALGQTPSHVKQLPDDPTAFVRSLYTDVVARKPLNVQSGEDWRIFAPYFSKALMHRFDGYSACMADWRKQNLNTTDKPPGLIEYDIFSGSSEEADPVAFHIERSETEKNGSIRVYVRLRWQEGKDKEVWRVAAVLTREDGRFVLDNVIFLKNSTRPDDVDTPLSRLLTDECEGSRWVGYRKH